MQYRTHSRKLPLHFFKFNQEGHSMAALPTDTPPAPLRDLFHSAKRACDHWGDSPAARQAGGSSAERYRRTNVLTLIEHLATEYPASAGP